MRVDVYIYCSGHELQMSMCPKFSPTMKNEKKQSHTHFVVLDKSVHVHAIQKNWYNWRTKRDSLLQPTQSESQQDSARKLGIETTLIQNLPSVPFLRNS